MTLARDLGNGPHRPFGSALHRQRVGPFELIGPTVKPSFMGPCKVCGERRFFCEHELSTEEEANNGRR